MLVQTRLLSAEVINHYSYHLVENCLSIVGFSSWLFAVTPEDTDFVLPVLADNEYFYTKIIVVGIYANTLIQISYVNNDNIIQHLSTEELHPFET